MDKYDDCLFENGNVARKQRIVAQHGGEAILRRLTCRSASGTGNGLMDEVGQGRTSGWERSAWSTSRLLGSIERPEETRRRREPVAPQHIPEVATRPRDAIAACGRSSLSAARQTGRFSIRTHLKGFANSGMHGAFCLVNCTNPKGYCNYE